MTRGSEANLFPDIYCPRQSPPHLHSKFSVGLLPAHLGTRGVAVLDEGLDTDLDLNLKGGLGVLDEAALLVVLVALLLLLSRVGGCVGGVAPTVIRVVTEHLVRREEDKWEDLKLHLLVVLRLLHLLHLVNASLAGSGNACKIHGNVVAALTVDPGGQRGVGRVEGESVDEGATGSLFSSQGRGEAAPENVET